MKHTRSGEGKISIYVDYFPQIKYFDIFGERIFKVLAFKFFAFFVIIVC